jgi:hypothetical protein
MTILLFVLFFIIFTLGCVGIAAFTIFKVFFGERKSSYNSRKLDLKQRTATDSNLTPANDADFFDNNQVINDSSFYINSTEFDFDTGGASSDCNSISNPDSGSSFDASGGAGKDW